MTTPITDGPLFAGQLHAVLLRMAGRVPDDLVAEARTWLASGQCVDVVQALAFGAVAGAVPIEPADADLFTAVLTEAGAGTEVLDDVRRGAADGYPPYTMAPVAPEILAEHGDAVPANVDLTGAYPTLWSADAADQAAVTAATALAGQVRLVGLWRAWRYPASQSPWPAPKRIYLLEVAAGVPEGELPAMAVAVQDALSGAGEQDPQAEVVVSGGDLPVYHDWVRGYGALLWAQAPTSALRIARTFDRADAETGPTFDPDHSCLDGDEQATLTRYLAAGESVLTTSARLPDLIDPAQGEVVPIDLRTDGRWIWSDATTYYLRRYGLAPDPELLGYLRERGSELPVVNSVDLHLAMVALQRGERDVVWTP